MHACNDVVNVGPVFIDAGRKDMAESDLHRLRPMQDGVLSIVMVVAGKSVAVGRALSYGIPRDAPDSLRAPARMV